MIFLTVHHRKGGVGKTTTVQNLALIFSQVFQMRTLAVDIDPQGNLSTSLGMKREKAKAKGTAELLDAVLSGEGFQVSRYLLKPKQNLDLLCGSERLIQSEENISNHQGLRGQVLQKSLRAVLREYDVILIDTAPSGGWLVNNALIASKKLLIPVECETFSVEGLESLKNQVRELGRSNETKIEVFGVVATQINKRRSSHASGLTFLEKNIPSLIFKTYIHTDSKVEIAQNRGFGVYEYSSQSRSAGEYKNLAKEIIERNGR